MAVVKVGIIDDGYPVIGEKRFSVERITDLTQNENWGFEESLRDLNIQLTSKSLIWKRKIHLEGFNHPETFITEGEFDKDFLIYDWEYKPFSEPHEQLLEILQLTTAKIFIYSAYDKIDRIPEILDEERFHPYFTSNRYEIRSKGNDDDADEIIKGIMEKFKAGETYHWKQFQLTIKPSKFIIDSDEFWLLQALLGSSNISNFLTEGNISLIDEDTIESMFKQSSYKFFIDKGKSILSASNNQLISSKLGMLTELSIFDAVNIFGIEKLEEAKEKGFTIIK